MTKAEHIQARAQRLAELSAALGVSTDSTDEATDMLLGRQPVRALGGLTVDEVQEAVEQARRDLEELAPANGS